MRWVKKPIAAQMKRAQTNMTYVVDGNKCANIVPQGQYFQLINSTIAGRSDGVYTASKAIPANEVIDNTYFNQTTPIAEGAINKINNELATLNSNIKILYSKTYTLSFDAYGAGTIGTRAAQKSISLSSDINTYGNIAALFISQIDNSSAAHYQAFMNGTTLYVNAYRAVSEATSAYSVKVTVTFAKSA